MEVATRLHFCQTNARIRQAFGKFLLLRDIAADHNGLFIFAAITPGAFVLQFLSRVFRVEAMVCLGIVFPAEQIILPAFLIWFGQASLAAVAPGIMPGHFWAGIALFVQTLLIVASPGTSLPEAFHRIAQAILIFEFIFVARHKAIVGEAFQVDLISFRVLQSCPAYIQLNTLPGRCLVIHLRIALEAVMIQPLIVIAICIEAKAVVAVWVYALLGSSKKVLSLLCVHTIYFEDPEMMRKATGIIGIGEDCICIAVSIPDVLTLFTNVASGIIALSISPAFFMEAILQIIAFSIGEIARAFIH